MPNKRTLKRINLTDVSLDDLEVIAGEATRQERALVAQLRIIIHREATRLAARAAKAAQQEPA